MAHVKAGAATKGNRDSVGKRRGIKVYGGAKVKPGMIIVRQKGTLYHPADGVQMGRDFTLFAVKKGIVAFKKKHDKQYITVV